MAKFFLGSVAERVIAAAPCPVMTFGDVRRGFESQAALDLSRRGNHEDWNPCSAENAFARASQEQPVHRTLALRTDNDDAYGQPACLAQDRAGERSLHEERLAVQSREAQILGALLELFVLLVNVLRDSVAH